MIPTIGSKLHSFIECYQEDAFAFISYLYNKFYHKAFSEIDDKLGYSFYIRIPKVKKLCKSKDFHAKSFTLTKVLFSFDTEGKEVIDHDKYSYHDVNPKSYAKKFAERILEVVTEYGNVQMYEFFSKDVSLDCSESFKKNKNIDIINKYVLFDYDDYENLKKKMKKELVKYEKFIKYEFKDSEIDVLSMFNNMFIADAYEYGYATEMSRKINYPLMFKLLTEYTKKFFNETYNSLNEYNLYNLLYNEDLNVLKLLCEICSVRTKGPKERYGNYLSREENINYFQTLIKVSFRLRNSEYIRYLGNNYPEQFKTYFKEEFLYYHYDIKLLKEMEYGGFVVVDDNFISNYVSSLHNGMLKKEYYTKEVEEDELIKFLDYLFYEVGYGNLKSHIKNILDAEMNPKMYSNMIYGYPKLMNYLYLSA